MEISSKGRYAVRVMAEIAKCGKDFVPISEIAASQGISNKYLEKIISLLKKADLLESERGATGGYRLAKPAGMCSVREILEATGDGVKLSKCSEQSCPLSERCSSREIWDTLDEIINNFLGSVTLQEILDKSHKNISQ